MLKKSFKHFNFPSGQQQQQQQQHISGDRFYVDIDESSQSLNRSIREAQLNRYNFALVVGEKEASTHTLNVRQRDGKQLGIMSLEDVKAMFVSMQQNYQ